MGNSGSYPKNLLQKYVLTLLTPAWNGLARVLLSQKKALNRNVQGFGGTQGRGRTGTAEAIGV